MTERPKYRVVLENNSVDFEETLNELAKEGYSIRHTMDDSGTFLAVMGLKTLGAVEAVKKVNHADVEKHTSGGNGWEVHEIYSGHTILIRRRE